MIMMTAALPRRIALITGTCRALGGIARVIHTGSREDPRFAPSISEMPTISGSAPIATSVTNISTAATDECMTKVSAAPTRNAIRKSPSRRADICGRKALSRIGMTVARISSSAIRIRATPRTARPICFGMADRLFRNVTPPPTSSSGASQLISMLRNWITRAEPRSAPSIAGRPIWKDRVPAPTNPATSMATATELCMMAASASPARLARIRALEPVINRRKDAPKARSMPVRTMRTANSSRIVAPASSRRN